MASALSQELKLSVHEGPYKPVILHAGCQGGESVMLFSITREAGSPARMTHHAPSDVPHITFLLVSLILLLCLFVLIDNDK
jgi:hypothetical protein